jgi:muramoyltetrapeptide carboxypeptidase LdcA involved in peptidoglycan recycling
VGDRVAVLSPLFAAPGFAPAVHEQAMRRLTSATGLIPVEFPTTRKLGSSRGERAADINAAFADPSIRAILATIGGDDQITVVPHIDEAAVRANPKIFVGYSDNTNLLNWLWSLGIRGYYGGSTQVHLGAGPGADDVHLASLRAALLTGGELEITDPGESEDFGPIGSSRGHSSNTATANPPNPGRGQVPDARSPVTPGVAASKSSTSSPSPTGCPPSTRSGTQS